MLGTGSHLGVFGIRPDKKQTIDHESLDTVLRAEWEGGSEENTRRMNKDFREYLEADCDEAEALTIFYGQPARRSESLYAMILTIGRVFCFPLFLIALASCTTDGSTGQTAHVAFEGNPHGVPVHVPSGVRIISDYGSRYVGTSGVTRASRDLPARHTGVDFAAEFFGAVVISPTFGKVVATAKPAAGRPYGHITVENPVPVDLGTLVDGQGQDFSYFEKIRVKITHVNDIAVEIGDTVKVGQPIARAAPGPFDPHVHMGTRSGGTRVNPHKLWFNGVGEVTCFDRNFAYPKDQFVLVVPLRC